jgi:hypothetical protein
VRLAAAIRKCRGETVAEGGQETGLAHDHYPEVRGPGGQRLVHRTSVLETVPARVSRAADQDRGECVEDRLDRTVALGVDADLEPADIEVTDYLGELITLERQYPRVLRRGRVGAVDSRGSAAHPAVGPDPHGHGGQPAGLAAPQAGRHQPVQVSAGADSHSQPRRVRSLLTAWCSPHRLRCHPANRGAGSRCSALQL